MANLTAMLSSFIAGGQPVALKSRWQFNNEHSTILLMHRPHLLCVPNGFFDEKVDLPILKRKVVVEQVYNCPGFFMYLSNKGGLCPILHMLHSFDDGLNAYLYIRPLASEQVSVSLCSDTGTNASSGQTLASTS
jgi:hypothetical protein